MNIALIGYRGTGKSTVGKILSERLGWDLISTDDEIITRAQQPIPKIVEQFGWNHFRELETEVCRSLANRNNLVLDTGGGVILKEENVKHLKANSMVFWLTASVPTITTRIGGDTQRPSLTGKKSFVEEIEEVLQERQPKYAAAANHTVSTDGLSAERVADLILAQL